MKKIMGLLLVFLLVFGFGTTINATTSVINQNSLSVTGTVNQITVTGTVDSTTCTAVVMVLYDSDGTTIQRTQSCAVQTDKTFTSTFDKLALKEDAKYTVKVADYNGGTWVTKEFQITAAKETEKEKETETTKTSVVKNPETGDSSNQLLWTCVLLVTGILLVVTAGIFIKRRNKSQNRQ